MRRRVWTTTIAVASLAAVISGYVYWQYKTAPTPPLDSINSYTSAVPTTDILEPRRSDAERQLRDLAASAEPSSRIVNERFVATNADFVWDAVRHHIESSLGPKHYRLIRDGWSPENSATYLAYRRSGLQQRFNEEVIVAAGLVKGTLRTANGSDVHLYGYFVLASS